MGADWDPVSGIRGVAWPVTRKGGSVVDGRRAAMARVVPTATETVTDVDLYVATAIGTGVYRADVWKESDLPPAGLSSTFVPTADKAAAGVGAVWTSTGANRWSTVDETVLDTTDYVTKAPANTSAGSSPPDAPGSWVVFTFGGTSGGLGAGAQIVTSVEVHAVCQVILATTPSLGGVNVGAEMNKRPHATTQFVTPAMGVTTLPPWTFTQNPITLVAWTEQDIIDLSNAALTNTHVGLTQFSPNGAGGAADEVRLHQFWIVVNYYNDTRLATADLTVTANGWKTWDTPNWTKTSAQNVITEVTRVSGSGQIVIGSLDSGLTAPSSPGAYRPSFDVNGNVSALNTVLTETHGIVFPVGGAASIDSQPYVDLVRSPVDTTHTIQQEFTADATDTRQWVQLVLGSTRHQIPAADLTVKIKRRSDNVQMGGTGTFSAQRLLNSPYPLQTLDVVLATGAALTNTTQYYLEAACTAAAGTGWDWALVDAKTPPVTGYTAGFGSNTDRVTVGGVEYDDLDALFVVGTVPAAPGSFTATGGANGITLAHSATALAGSWAGYEYQRQDPDGEWCNIRLQTTSEATVSYLDYTPLQGVAETYRVGVRHTNGTINYSATASATRANTGTSLLCSNETPTKYVFDLKLNGNSVTFPKTRVEQNKFGARYPDVTSATKDRGLTLNGEVDLNAVATERGIVLWDQLRNLVDANPTAWAFIDTNGGRWWVDLSINGGSLIIGSLAKVQVHLVQTQLRPPVVTG